MPVTRDPSKMNFHTHPLTLKELKEALRHAQTHCDVRNQKDGDITWNCLMMAERVIDEAFYNFRQSQEFYTKYVDVNG